MPRVSRDTLAHRTGRAGYPPVSAGLIKLYENQQRYPGDAMLASLGHALRATPEEFPAAALAQARLLLDERIVGLDVALLRRAWFLGALRRHEGDVPPAPADELTRPPEDPQTSSESDDGEEQDREADGP